MDAKSMKVLIIGGTGMLGHKLWLTFQKRFDTFVTIRESHEKYKSLNLFDPDRTFSKVDVENKKRLQEVFDKIKPNVVVNCVGIIKQLPEAKEEILSIKINSLFPHELAALADLFGTKLIHISTDCVFSGKKGNYSEDDIPDPTDLYGRTKLLGEVNRKPHLTIRSSIIGRDFFHRLGLLEWFLGRSPGEKVKGFTNAIYTGLTTRTMAQAIAWILKKHPSLTGLIQIASQPIDKYSLLKMLQKAFDLDRELMPFEDFRCDRSLNGNFFNKVTGFSPPSWDTMIEELKEENNFYMERGF